MVEWEKELLGNLVTLESGLSPSLLTKGSLPYFKVDQLNNSNKYQRETPYLVSYNNPISVGSLIFPKRGAAVFQNKIRILTQPSFIDTNLMAMTVSSNRLYNEYLYYWLTAYNLGGIADTTSVPQINNKHIFPLEIPLPPLPEQRRIATVLSDTDELIATLEKLIAKKRAIKQGAMQELLTGKRRLPGFNGEWVEKKLGEVVNIIMGQSPDSNFYNTIADGLPLIQGNADIENRFTIIRFYTSQITKLAKKGDIILTVRAPVGNVAKTEFDCCLGRGVCAIKGNEFLYHYLVYIEPFWASLSKGSTFDSINSQELYDVVLKLPQDVAEQTAIASILSDMDAEIDALTAKLNKYKHIKQGMMSELLTGHIRLPEGKTE